jgi:hypothetical protein
VTDYLETIKARRQAAQDSRSASDTHKQTIDATLASGKGVVAATKDLAKKDDIDKMIAQLKEMQLAQLMATTNGQNQKTMNITDSAAYVGDAIDKLGETILSKLADDTSDKATKEQLGKLQTAINQLNTARSSDVTLLQASFKQLHQAIADMEVNPVVNIDPPQVTVNAPKVDFKPLQDTIKQYFATPVSETEDTLDLDDYKAQDITEDGNIQYVGFVSPSGAWYIIENNISENSMRYVFGSKGYAKAFKKAPTYQYYLLNEAINATA